MGLFEFLMVLISVVIGLGLTEVLTGVANLLQAREGSAAPPPPETGSSADSVAAFGGAALGSCRMRGSRRPPAG